jgi:hypothetical protein
MQGFRKSSGVNNRPVFVGLVCEAIPKAGQCIWLSGHKITKSQWLAQRLAKVLRRKFSFFYKKR